MRVRRKIYNRLYPVWKSRIATGLKKRRLGIINDLACRGNLFDPDWLRDKKLLDVGCANGKDFLQFFDAYDGVQLFGLDRDEYKLAQKNCTFVKGNARDIPFDSKFFDLVVSIGVLEHIDPIENLCKAITEIDRVGKSYIVVVPAISTLLEPHTVRLLWQQRDRSKKSPYPHLYYFSDDTWLQFAGFKQASLKRFNYLPPLIANVAIYKPCADRVR